jgi:hypothetical protein
VRTVAPSARRPGGSWSPNHGRGAYQLELPPPPGRIGRRQLRRSVFASRDDAVAELRHAQDLLGLAGRDTTLTAQIATMLTTVKSGQPLPERDAVARRVPAGVSPTAAFTVGEYLWQWYRSRKVQATTLYGYEGYIRMVLSASSGSTRLRLWVPPHLSGSRCL